MTLQEVLDYIGSKLADQGKRCVTGDLYSSNSCCYGDGNGSHCAVGWILDSKDESLMYWNGGIDSLLNRYPSKVPSIIKENFKLFNIIQAFHDGSNGLLGNSCNLDVLRQRYPDLTFSSDWDKFASRSLAAG